MTSASVRIIKTGPTRVVAFAALLLILGVRSVAATPPLVTYDADLGLLFGGLEFGDMQAQSAGSSAAGRGTFHLSMYQVPAERDNSGFAKIVLAAAPLCLASHDAGITELTLEELGSILYGNVTVPFRVVLGPVATSAASYQLLQSLNDRGVAGFESAADWAPAMKANRNIVWVSNDVELSTYIATHASVIGPQGAMLTTAAETQCLRIHLVSQSRDSVSFSQTSTTSGVQRIVHHPDHGDARVFTQGLTYPLMGGLLVTGPMNATCEQLEALRNFLIYFYTNSSVPTALLALNVIGLDASVHLETLVILSNFISSSSCAVSVQSIQAIGELSAYDAIAIMTMQSLPGPLVDFPLSSADPNTSHLLAAVQKAETTIAFLDSPTVAQVEAVGSDVIVAPLFSLSVAVAYNLDGYDSLMASPCSMLGLLNGSIAYWDDPRMVRDNAGAAIPHVKVTRVISTTSTLQSLIGGLNRLYASCNGVASGPYTAGVWPFGFDATADYIDLEITIRDRYGSLGLLPAPTAQHSGLQMLPVRLRRGLGLAPGDSTVHRVVASSTLDPSTNVVVLPSSGLQLYPFVTTVHVAMRASYAGNCAAVSAALGFLDHTTTPDAVASIDAYGYTPLPAQWRGVLPKVIRRVTCDGALVFGVSSNQPQSSTVEIVVGVAAGLLLVFGGLAAAKMSRTRSHSTAPKDEAEPFAIVFTDVQSSTALWATAPVEMGPALDQHHALMREAIAATGGYEVKTIGDSFMVAYRSAKDAVRFGLLVQRLFHEAEWAGVFDEFYRTELGGKDDTDAAVLAQYDSAAYGSLWRGLRVRVGVHYGSGQIKLDPVTQAYDYYGTVVNTAARVEAVGHGGQVCVTAAALEAAGLTANPSLTTSDAPFGPKDSSLHQVSVKDLGPQELYGLTEHVRLYQVLPIELGARLFPTLRLHRAAEKADETEDDMESWSAFGASDNSGAVPIRLASVDRFFQQASEHFNGRMTATELALQYRFLSTLVAAPRASISRSAVLQSYCEAWRIDMEARTRYERRVEHDAGVDALHMCKIVTRIAAMNESSTSASASKHSPDTSCRSGNGAMSLHSADFARSQRLRGRHSSGNIAVPSTGNKYAAGSDADSLSMSASRENGKSVLDGSEAVMPPHAEPRRTPTNSTNTDPRAVQFE